MLRDVEGQDNGEDCVRSAGLAVHVGGGHRPGLVALLHEVLNLLSISHSHRSQALDIGTKNIVLPYLKIEQLKNSNFKTHLTFNPFFLPAFSQSNKSNTFSL